MPKDRRITDVDGLIREARRRGGEVEMTSKGHYKITGPGGMATVCRTWGDPRVRENSIADLRRYAGIDVTKTPINQTSPKLNGHAPESTYDKAALTDDLDEAQRVETPVSRDDHDALLSMLSEQGKEIDRNTANLDYLNKALNSKIMQLEKRLKGVDDLTALHGRYIARMNERLDNLEHQVSASGTEMNRLLDVVESLARNAGINIDPEKGKLSAKVTRMSVLRERSLEFLASLPVGLQISRASIGEHIKCTDHDGMGLLSKVLQELRKEGLVVNTGTRGSTRWSIVRAQ